MFMMLSFYDRKNEVEMKRYVSLENIFAHNPTFYKDLISCKSLIHNDVVKLSYNELPDNTKALITASYKKSISSEKTAFMY